jgi:glutathione synthase/RimK-type ligase-like ATP-grasp enzyme
MKTIAIYVDSLELPGRTFENGHYWEAYSDLLLLLKARGVEAYLVSDNGTYLGKGIFTQGFTFAEKLRSPEEMTHVPFIRADVVYNRGAFAGNDIPVFNSRQVHLLGMDKILMFEQLGKYQAFSVACHSRRQLKEALDQIKTDLVVVKDPIDSGGRGVWIGTREEVLAKVPAGRYPLLAQEFMDTSVGIPGILEGMHDLRLEIGGGEIWTCYVRTPKKGEYRANVAQGGTARYIPRQQTPPAVAELAKRIDARFGSQPRFYAMDFANTPEGWKLIELNSQPGLVALNTNEEVAYGLTRLADYLGSITRNMRTPFSRKALSLPVSAVRLAAAEAAEVERVFGAAAPDSGFAPRTN